MWFQYLIWLQKILTTGKQEYVAQENETVIEETPCLKRGLPWWCQLPWTQQKTIRIPNQDWIAHQTLYEFEDWFGTFGSAVTCWWDIPWISQKAPAGQSLFCWRSPLPGLLAKLANPSKPALIMKSNVAMHGVNQMVTEPDSDTKWDCPLRWKWKPSHRSTRPIAPCLRNKISIVRSAHYRLHPTCRIFRGQALEVHTETFDWMSLDESFWHLLSNMCAPFLVVEKLHILWHQTTWCARPWWYDWYCERVQSQLQKTTAVHVKSKMIPRDTWKEVCSWL